MLYESIFRRRCQDFFIQLYLVIHWLLAFFWKTDADQLESSSYMPQKAKLV